MSASAACCALRLLVSVCPEHTLAPCPQPAGRLHGLRELPRGTLLCAHVALSPFSRFSGRAHLLSFFFPVFCVNLKMRDKWKENRKRRRIEGRYADYCSCSQWLLLTLVFWNDTGWLCVGATVLGRWFYVLVLVRWWFYVLVLVSC